MIDKLTLVHSQTDAPAGDFSQAYRILGRSFASIEDVVAARLDEGYTLDQVKLAEKNLPSSRMMRHLSRNGFCLVPYPSEFLRSLEKVGNPFSLWLAVKIDPETATTDMTWLQQHVWINTTQNVEGGLYVPSAFEMDWAMQVFLHVHGTRLFQGYAVRTSTRSAGGQACVSSHGISYPGDNYRDDRVSLAIGCKLKPLSK